MNYDFFGVTKFYFEESRFVKIFQVSLLKLEQSRLLSFWFTAFAVFVSGQFESKWAIAEGYTLLWSLDTRTSNLSIIDNSFDIGGAASLLAIYFSNLPILIRL